MLAGNLQTMGQYLVWKIEKSIQILRNDNYLPVQFYLLFILKSQNALAISSILSIHFYTTQVLTSALTTCSLRLNSHSQIIGSLRNLNSSLGSVPNLNTTVFLGKKTRLKYLYTGSLLLGTGQRDRVSICTG